MAFLGTARLFEGKKLATIASMGPRINPEPASKAMVPIIAMRILCRMPASPPAKRTLATPRTA